MSKTNPNLQDVPHPKPIGGEQKHWPESVVGHKIENPRRSPLAEVSTIVVPDRDNTPNRP
jgi:hypothetical protein